MPGSASEHRAGACARATLGRAHGRAEGGAARSRIALLLSMVYFGLGGATSEARAGDEARASGGGEAPVTQGAVDWCRLPEAVSAPVPVERVVAEFTAAELGGPAAPRFVFARVLRFEARLLALADGARTMPTPFNERHLRVALRRHIAETLLAARTLGAAPSRDALERRLNEVRRAAVVRSGGEAELAAAARAEGLAANEVTALFLRRARASFYAHLALAPLLEPAAELIAREVVAMSGVAVERTSREQRAEARARLIERRLDETLDETFRGARARLGLRLVDRTLPRP